MRHWLGSDRLTLGLLGLAMGLLCLSGQEDIAVEESDVEGAVSASELKPTADGDLFESLESVDDARVLAWAKDLGLEERRYILYLYGRLNRPKVAERLAVDILADDPSNKAALLVLASMYTLPR
jgi:hypothetical protein